MCTKQNEDSEGSKCLNTTKSGCPSTYFASFREGLPEEIVSSDGGRDFSRSDCEYRCRQCVL